MVHELIICSRMKMANMSRLAVILVLVATVTMALDPNDSPPELDIPDWSHRSKHIRPKMVHLINQFWADIEQKMDESYKDLIPVAYRERSNSANRLYEFEVAGRLKEKSSQYRVLVVGIYGPIDDDDKHELRYVGDATVY